MLPKITRTSGWTDMMAVEPLCVQLEDADIPWMQHEVSNLIGTGGSAYWIHFVSPKTGSPVTVLCVPHHDLPDGAAEDYYYFDGMGYEEALDVDWAAVYEHRAGLADGVGE